MRNFLMIAAATMAFAAPASAATVLAYDTENGASVAATETGAGVTGFDLTRGAGLTQNTGGTFNSRGWTETSLSDAVADGDFLSFGFTSTTAYNLNSLEIGYDRSNTGAMEIQLQVKVVDGPFTTTLFNIFSDSDIATNGEENTIDLSSIVDPFGGGFFFENVTNVEFTLFGWGATSDLGTFDIEKNTVGPNSEFGIFVSGEAVAAVPLPAALPMLAGALGLFGLIRRKA